MPGPRPLPLRVLNPLHNLGKKPQSASTRRDLGVTMNGGGLPVRAAGCQIAACITGGARLNYRLFAPWRCAFWPACSSGADVAQW